MTCTCTCTSRPTNTSTSRRPPTEATTAPPPPTASDLYDRTFSFGGGGWLMVYEFGIAKALRRVGAHQRARFIGVSAGSLASIALALDADLDAIMQTMVTHYLPRTHADLWGPFRMREYLLDALSRHINLHRFRELNARPARVGVVYSSLSHWQSRQVTAFDSVAHLQHALMASCCATPIAGAPFVLKGEWVFDGVLLDRQPRFPEENEGEEAEEESGVIPTVTVSTKCDATGVDIKPSRYMPSWWYAYPPSASDMDWVYRLGLHDGLQWLQSQGYDVGPCEDPGDLEWETRLGAAIGYRTVDNACARLGSQMDTCWFALLWLLLQLELALLLAFRILWDHERAVIAISALSASWCTMLLTMPVVPTLASLLPLLPLVVAVLTLVGADDQGIQSPPSTCKQSQQDVDLKQTVSVLRSVASRLRAPWTRPRQSSAAVHPLPPGSTPSAGESASERSRSDPGFGVDLGEGLHEELLEISSVYRWLVSDH